MMQILGFREFNCNVLKPASISCVLDFFKLAFSSFLQWAMLLLLLMDLQACPKTANNGNRERQLKLGSAGSTIGATNSPYGATTAGAAVARGPPYSHAGPIPPAPAGKDRKSQGHRGETKNDKGIGGDGPSGGVAQKPYVVRSCTHSAVAVLPAL